ncbi:hypothetical protein BGX20_006957 [Mortierella sp. AD010]|nr:hypothetical protein BGX20_006957 [Mortierella sp. AD010]
MFWVDDPSLSIGLMVVPETDSTSTQTGSGSIGPKPNATTPTGASGATNNASTSTSALNTTGFAVSPNPSPTSSGLANVALAGAVINSAMSTTSVLSGSTATGGTGVGYGVSRMTSTTSATKRGRQMSSLNEKQSLEDSDQEYQTWENVNGQEQDRRDELITTTTTTTTEEYVQSTVRSAPEREADHVSLKME